MDTNIERQVLRVLGAFQKAANKNWGPDTPLDPTRERKPRQRSRIESPQRQAARECLRENPGATNAEASWKTGANKHILSELRRELGCCRAREEGNRKRVEEALKANPEASGRQIAKLAGVTERYAQDVIKRLKLERSRI
jgi:hypothetical protein